MKKLTLSSCDEIKTFLKGTVRLEQSSDGISGRRFTVEQEEAYREKKDFLTKSFASSGMILEFFTDAGSCKVVYSVSIASSRKFWYMDVKVNGVLTMHNGSDDITAGHSGTLEIALDGRKNLVQIYMHGLSETTIKEVIFEDGTILEPVKRSKKMIAFGDSITQGYDARFPSIAYASALADALDAELFNKAIGGEVFNPDLLTAPDPFTPDIITVAYGTNDWSKMPAADFQKNCKEFFCRLVSLYPDTPIFVIIPLWRKDLDRITNVGKFEDARSFIASDAGQYRNCHLIDGMKLTPHLPDFFSDGYLHPNDDGFLFMAAALEKEVKKVLDI